MPQTNEMLGPYRIVKTIGSGGMATVYHAVDTRHNRVVALKVLLPRYQHQADVVERFRREGHNAAQLQHPHIVTVYESGVVNGTVPYITMDYVVGNSLSAWLQQNQSPLPLDYAANILAHHRGCAGLFAWAWGRPPGR